MMQLHKNVVSVPFRQLVKLLLPFQELLPVELVVDYIEPICDCCDPCELLQTSPTDAAYILAEGDTCICGKIRLCPDCYIHFGEDIGMCRLCNRLIGCDQCGPAFIPGICKSQLTDICIECFAGMHFM